MNQQAQRAAFARTEKEPPRPGRLLFEREEKREKEKEKVRGFSNSVCS